jgi:two-component sensor histidine kinase
MPKTTLRSQLVRVVALALLPLLLVALLQAWLAIEDSRDVVASRLRANAWAVSEQQRHPFIIAEQALAIARRQPEVRDVGPRCDAALVALLEGYDGIVNYIRTGPDGRARCSALPFSPGADLSRDPWWLQRQGRRTLYLSTPQIGRISGMAVWIMVQPLFSADNEFVGTVSAGVGITGLTTALQQQERALPGALVIVDQSGNPIIPSRKARFGDFAAVSAAQQTPEQLRLTNGSDWTYVSAPLFRDQLYVVYAEPTRTVTGAALSRIWPALLLPLLALVLSSAAIWFATRWTILRWLERLRLITARFARGDFTRELSQFEFAPREMATFAVDLHDMADAIAAKQQRLSDALSHNMAMVSEVNHRVRNNLQIVVSMLSLEAGRVNEPRAALALHQARTRIAALALVHRLMYVGEGSEESGQVALHDLLPELCMQLRSAYREREDVSLDCTTQELTVTADQAVALTLFVIEAVGNAFMHAFPPPRSGSMTVSIATGEDCAVVSVADNGSGFDKDKSSDSVGMTLIEGFAQQVGGTIELATGPGGTRIRLSFPLVAAPA